MVKGLLQCKCLFSASNTDDHKWSPSSLPPSVWSTGAPELRGLLPPTGLHGSQQRADLRGFGLVQGGSAEEPGQARNGDGLAWNGDSLVLNGDGLVLNGDGLAWNGNGQARNGTVWHGMGMVWHGMGTVWDGMGTVWHGMGTVRRGIETVRTSLAPRMALA